MYTVQDFSNYFWFDCIHEYDDSVGYDYTLELDSTNYTEQQGYVSLVSQIANMEKAGETLMLYRKLAYNTGSEDPDDEFTDLTLHYCDDPVELASHYLSIKNAQALKAQVDSDNASFVPTPPTPPASGDTAGSTSTPSAPVGQVTS